jgi:hypothetical protein
VKKKRIIYREPTIQQLVQLAPADDPRNPNGGNADTKNQKKSRNFS